MVGADEGLRRVHVAGAVSTAFTSESFESVREPVPGLPPRDRRWGETVSDAGVARVVGEASGLRAGRVFAIPGTEDGPRLACSSSAFAPRGQQQVEDPPALDLRLVAQGPGDPGGEEHPLRPKIDFQRDGAHEGVAGLPAGVQVQPGFDPVVDGSELYVFVAPGAVFDVGGELHPGGNGAAGGHFAVVGGAVGSFSRRITCSWNGYQPGP